MYENGRNQILIVDDEELNRELLKQIFEESFNILTSGNGREALEIYEAHRNTLAAVLLDLVMPEVDGYRVLQVLKAAEETCNIPVIIITANTDMKSALDCYDLGAAEVINKPFVSVIVRQRVMNMIEMFSSREILRNQLTESENQLEKFNDNFIDTISDIVEFRDLESGQHVKRVKGLTRILAQTYAELYPDCGLDGREIDIITKSAALHDIGKIAIPDSILLKPGRLTDDEMKIMKEHTVRGCDILKKLENVQDDEHYKVAYEIVRYHHERFDGRGYPDGLSGEDIPLSAAFVSVADVYDALTSDRVYKKAFDKQKAYNMIMNGECGVFNPKLLKCLEHSKEVIELFADSLSGKEI